MFIAIMYRRVEVVKILAALGDRDLLILRHTHTHTHTLTHTQSLSHTQTHTSTHKHKHKYKYKHKHTIDKSVTVAQVEIVN